MKKCIKEIILDWFFVTVTILFVLFLGYEIYALIGVL